MRQLLPIDFFRNCCIFERSLILALALSPMFLSGCGNEAISSAAINLVKFESSAVWIDEVRFKVLSDINDNSPVIIDLIIAYTPTLYQDMTTLTSEQYFAAKSQLQRDFPQDLEVHSWQAVPGQPLLPQAINPKRTNGKGAIVFARYQSPGPHRAQIGDAQIIEIKLDRTDFQVKKIK